eukprot:CAMPEP_0178745914 /NCGR_PEP_ID=MMETSP0744-20121128/7540_1 /TAXON_ID=913974 /ORGANISM="Nitzschia punctata, Strain CCMP561" /LENGTH=581 /DNA_ID=CAMNT_0020399111 /DNA_START=52 /DNA_END=1797 /DNA_ORIENTATION=-
MQSTFPIVPAPENIDLASEDIVNVNVDLEKNNTDPSSNPNDDGSGTEAEDDAAQDLDVIKVDTDMAGDSENTGTYKRKKVCLLVFVGLTVLVAVLVGALVATKDQRMAKKSGSNVGVDNMYSCSTTTSTCPAMVEGEKGNGTFTFLKVGTPLYGEEAQDLFGMALSMNCDGTIVAVGSSQHDGRSGQVKVYRWITSDGQSVPSVDGKVESVSSNSGEGEWLQMGQTLEGNLGSTDQFGHAVSLSYNGRRLAIGGRFADDGEAENIGSVQIFEFMSGEDEEDSWQPVGEVILGEAAGDQAGRSLELDWDGSRLIVGASGNDGSGEDAGHARVYEWKESIFNDPAFSWQQLGSDIDGEDVEDRSGSAVAMSADGTVVAIGAYKNDASGTEDAGHVRVFVYDDNAADWVQMGNDIDGSGNGDWTGLSMALSGDGTRLVVGAPGSNERFWPGVSKVYDFVNGTWTQIGDDLEGGGYSVDVTFDGSRVALGSHRGFENGPNSGQVLVYEYQSIPGKNSSSFEWVPILGKETPIVGDAGSMFGSRVGISSDGMRIIASAPAVSDKRNDNSLTSVGNVMAYDLCPMVV